MTISKNIKPTTALSYLKAGWKVLPVYGVVDGKCQCSKGKNCTRHGKHPITKHGVKDATGSRSKVKAFWKKYPTANIGVATGTPSGILVLDNDPRNGGETTLAAAKIKLGKLPRSPKSRTPSNGSHLVFTLPKKVIRSNTSGKLIGPGLDVLSTGSYFVAPGSKGVGGSYRWAKDRALAQIINTLSGEL